MITREFVRVACPALYRASAAATALAWNSAALPSLSYETLLPIGGTSEEHATIIATGSSMFLNSRHNLCLRSNHVRNQMEKFKIEAAREETGIRRTFRAALINKRPPSNSR